jgi:methyl-accepting chemotaxis protein
MEALANLRITANRFFTIFLWLHVPLIVATASFVGEVSALNVGILALILTIVPHFVIKQRGDAPLTRYMVAVSLMLMVALFVYCFSNHYWQIDAHMYFFAALAMLSAYSDWRTILVAMVTVALHHLLLNFIFPMAIFPDGADFFRVIFHAVIVIVETAVLLFITNTVSKSLLESEALLHKTDEQQALMASLEEQKEEVKRQQEERAKQTIRLSDEFEQNLGPIIAHFSTTIEELKKTAATMLESSETSNRVGENIAGQILQSSENIQGISGAAEEMTASIREIAHKLEESNQIAQQAFDKVESSNKIAEELQEAAQNVSNVTGLIREITEQTNLLALNATIEAARAGEAGKGFAVVAQEVKELASRASQATEEINQEISLAQQKTNETVRMIENIGALVRDLHEVSTSVAAAVGQQSATTQEIASLIGNAASSSKDINRQMDEMKNTADTQYLQAETVAQNASRLYDQNQQLQQNTDHFLNSVKKGS